MTLAIVAKISMVKPYPLSEEDTKLWAATIFRLDPKVTNEELKEVIDGFITGRYDFNKDLGIRNIFDALELLRNNDVQRGYFQIP